MMQIVSTKKNIAMVVYEDAGTIRIYPLEKYNPMILDDRAPKFNGSFEQAINYVHNIM